jgi:DNA methylase
VTDPVAIPVDSVRYVKELYPRLNHDEAAIERYRDALDRVPPIKIARGGILVDGYHRWQAHRREDLAMVPAIDLGDLSDAEIMAESIRLNADHGVPMTKADKAALAKKLYPSLDPATAVRDLADLLLAGERSVQRWTQEQRAASEIEQREQAYDLWLDCLTDIEIAQRFGVTDRTIRNWLGSRRQMADLSEPPELRQHFDIWQLPGDDDSAYFGRLPAGLVDNLLWFYTQPGDTVVDLFAGRGTSIRAAKRMGRRIWASDRRGNFWDETLPIHVHDVADGWPDDAPAKANLILLDPPYWQQAKGRYSDDPADLGNMPLQDFYAQWDHLFKECAEHLADDGHIAFIISGTLCDDGVVIDHAMDMTDRANALTDMGIARRIIVPYQTQQATGAQVTYARENKRLLKLYRDLVVMAR